MNWRFGRENRVKITLLQDADVNCLQLKKERIRYIRGGGYNDLSTLRS